MGTQPFTPRHSSSSPFIKAFSPTLCLTPRAKTIKGKRFRRSEHLMPFQKARGLRLRRRLVDGWRWMLPGRSIAYSLLEPPSYQFTEENHGSPPGMERLAGWVRSLKHRFKQPELVVGGDGEKRPPKGHLVVYVGGGEKGVLEAQPKRYVVPVVYFNHPLFGELLREVEEEFGYSHPGGITIPCSVCRFERVKARIAGDSCGYRSGLRRCHRSYR